MYGSRMANSSGDALISTPDSKMSLTRHQAAASSSNSSLSSEETPETRARMKPSGPHLRARQSRLDFARTCVMPLPSQRITKSQVRSSVSKLASASEGPNESFFRQSPKYVRSERARNDPRPAVEPIWKHTSTLLWSDCPSASKGLPDQAGEGSLPGCVRTAIARKADRVIAKPHETGRTRNYCQSVQGSRHGDGRPLS